MEPSILSLIPPVLTLVIALWSKNIMLALFLGIVSCSIYTGGLHFLMLVFDKYIYNGISSNVDMFIYMIVFGAFMVAVKRGGGFAAFSSFGDKHFDTPRKAKLITWLLSGIVINQGFGTIGVGAIMRPITDKQKVSREKLGYILSSTAEPVVALVPITIYILVFGGLISSVLPELDGQQVFVESIPYNFFCILSVLVGLLTAAELLPDFGFMKKREKAAKENGELIRPGSSPMETKELDDTESAVKPDFLSFVLPFVVFFIAIIVIRIETGMFSLMTPILVGTIVAIGYPVIRGYFKFSEVPGLIIDGAKSMVSVAVLLALAFGFGKAVADIGFADYIVSVSQNVLTPAILPAAVFLICAVASYATVSLISACFLLGPIALVLVATVGGNIPLVVAALVGGSTFGDVTSPLSDIVIESAMGAGVDTIDLGKAQLLPRVILALITTVLYVIFGAMAG